jgi:lysozyme family protein
MTTWDRAIAFVLAAEGGYVADDAGKGPSNFGINAAAHPGVDIKDLTRDQAIAIYKSDYWTPLGLDAVEPSLAIAAFDTAVNMGVGRARRYLSTTGHWRELLAQRAHDYVTFERFSAYGREWLTRVYALYLVCLKEESGSMSPTPKEKTPHA